MLRKIGFALLVTLAVVLVLTYFAVAFWLFPGSGL